MRIYNTLTKQKEKFFPQNSEEIKMYTCGVTVYDHCHIGHGRSLYVFEIVRRFLTHKGWRVKLVRNITDVDDKIIDKAREWSRKERISLRQAFKEVREFYIKSYYDDLKRLEIPPATYEPLATDCIPEMVDFISKLVEKGIGYKRGGNVYFSVRKFSDYGKLSGKKIDELYTAVRIEPDPFKEDSLDFALWKARKEEEPFWDSVFGKGRPGWHIECSAMVKKYLGETIDIHGGGQDLIFPHHDNEIAQSEALTGKPFARYWMHHGLLTINNQKMAKSLNNYVTLKEIIEEYSADVLKIFFLTTHYRNGLDFSSTKMREAARVKERILIFGKQLNSRLLKENKGEERSEKFYDERIERLYHKFVDFMEDDFNTPSAFSVIFELIRLVNENLLGEEKRLWKEARQLLYTILKIFSLKGILRELSGEVEPTSLSQKEEWDDKKIEEKVIYREKLRKERKFKEADAIREELAKKGIVLEDLPGGKTIWYRK